MKIKYIILAIALLVAAFSVQTYRLVKTQDRNDIITLNNKAYKSQLDELNETNTAFVMTIDELRQSNDSVLRQLDSMRTQLSIKDSKIQQMGRIKEYVYITDTVTFHDTIFKEKDFVLDTTLGDEWYTNHLMMRYPGTISSMIDVNTEQSCFMHKTRETVNKPCRLWIGRLFQRKHDVYNVTVIEHNPYAKVKENKFVIIDKK